MFRSEKRERVVASISTLIAEGTSIHGDVRFEGGLHLDGRIDGTIAAQAAGAVLTLSEKGRIKGEVRVFSAVINGAIEGDLLPAVRVAANSGATPVPATAALAAIEKNPHSRALAAVISNWSQLYGALTLLEQAAPQS